MLLLAVLLLILAFSIWFFKIKWNYTYWERKGLDYIKPDFFYGCGKELITGQLSYGDTFAKFYNYFKDKGLKHGGVYLGTKPVYIPVDTEILKNIMQKDFNYFMNRTQGFDPQEDPLEQNLVHLHGERWRDLRAKLTPTFTSGKMKLMFPTMVSCTAGLKDILYDHAKLQDPVDIKDALSRFTTDIIGSVAFGIDCNSLKNPNSDFRIYGKKIFESHTRRSFTDKLSMFIPGKLLKKMGFSIKKTDQNVEDFFMGIVNSAVRYREENNIYRRDVLQLLLQIRNTGKVTDDENIICKKTGEQYLTMDEIAAQCFVFFSAGFETSATTVTFALLELAINQDIQEKLRKEIKTVLIKYNNQITYEAIMEMQYLDKVISETLRKHPPANITPRVCTKNYKIPKTDVIIDKGTVLFISIQGLHKDPEYFPDPEKFDPERFNEENKASRKQFTYIPFGEGPRICIGARFGLLQAKVGLVAVISSVKITVNEKTKLPIKHSTKSAITSVDGDVWLNVTKVD